MNITRGASTEFGRNKVSVLVEECDLLRMLAEVGAEDPAATSAGMPTKDVLLAMDEEAKAFLAFCQLSVTPKGSEEERALNDKARYHRGERNRALAKHVPALAEKMQAAAERRKAEAQAAQAAAG